MEENNHDANTTGTGKGQPSSDTPAVAPAAIPEHDRLRMLLDGIATVQRRLLLQHEEPNVVFGTLLAKILELMDSEYGFIGEIKLLEEDNKTPYLQTHAITNVAWDAATHQFYSQNVHSGLKFYNLKSLFGRVMVTAEVMIENDPANSPHACGVPPGHPALTHFLGIPFFDCMGKMNGMVGIANKPGGYAQADVDFLEPFTVTCSNLIQAYHALRKNKELEQVVQRLGRATTTAAEQQQVAVPKAEAQQQHVANKEGCNIDARATDVVAQGQEQQTSTATHTEDEILGQERRQLLEQLKSCGGETSSRNVAAAQRKYDLSEDGKVPAVESSAGSSVSQDQQQKGEDQQRQEEEISKNVEAGAAAAAAPSSVRARAPSQVGAFAVRNSSSSSPSSELVQMEPDGPPAFHIRSESPQPLSTHTASALSSRRNNFNPSLSELTLDRTTSSNTFVTAFTVEEDMAEIEQRVRKNILKELGVKEVEGCVVEDSGHNNKALSNQSKRNHPPMACPCTIL